MQFYDPLPLNQFEKLACLSGSVQYLLYSNSHEHNLCICSSYPLEHAYNFFSPLETQFRNPNLRAHTIRP